MENSRCPECSSQFWVAALAVTVLALGTGCRCQSLYIVGDDVNFGWSDPPSLTYFQDWADQREFAVNDRLHFAYSLANDYGYDHITVVQTQQELDTCSITNAVLGSGGNDSTTITLSTNNTEYYFMSFNESYCAAGMRFRIALGHVDNQSSTIPQVKVGDDFCSFILLLWSPKAGPNLFENESLPYYPFRPDASYFVAFYNLSKIGNSSVNLVEEEDYNQCNSSNPLKTYKFGEAVPIASPLASPENFYFIAGKQSLCQESSMKYNVTFAGGITSSSSAPSPPGPSPNRSALGPSPRRKDSSPSQTAAGPSPRADNAGPSDDSRPSIPALALISVTVVVFVIGYVWQRNRRGRRQVYDVLNGDLGKKGRFRVFTAKELKVATNNFSSDNELGKGAFGTVYKGLLSDGQVVAVKRAITETATDTEQFINEVSILSQVNHCNLVKLMGCCVDNKLPLVVYEFIPNGTLQQHLRNSEQCSSTKLDWPCRLRIAIQIAEALKYLHSEANPSIVHRDIKAANILLDNDLGAKVADFGISKLFDIGATHMSTACKGTPGYIDPEYYFNCQFTEKSDVYSYGMVLLELITSKKPIDLTLEPDEQNLAVRLVPMIKSRRAREIIDSHLLIDFSEEDFENVEAVAEVAVACLGIERPLRPSMTEVVEMLRRIPEREKKMGSKTLQLFSLSELKMATNNFSSVNKLGNGAFGDVYKGVLKDGQVVAVKRARTERPKDMDQLFNEMSILSQVRHAHLVKLMGYCVDSKLPLVVCEFISNGTLEEHLSKSQQTSSSKLDWPCRLRIAIQVADGLHYLHSQVNPPIIHRDVKAANILLDDHFQAKIADFGLSKLFDIGDTHISTAIKGTPGYMDPEYFLTSQLTEKSDVYSYGMVLLELITSKKPIDLTLEPAKQNLAVRLVPLIKQKCARDIIDTHLVTDFSEEDFETWEAVAEVAAACLEKERASRPSMNEVAEMFKRIPGLKLPAEAFFKTNEIPNKGRGGGKLLGD